MNLRFLGDALDHWKGSVFEGLQGYNILEDLRIDAMASDGDSWCSEDWSLYAKLLRVRPLQIVQHAVTLYGDRVKYFDEIPLYGDLFLDPDTGIQTGRVNNIRQYLMPNELFALMNKERRRIIVVYQHVRAMSTRDRLEAVLHALRSVHPNFFCVSYNSSTVALLFFSFKRERVEAIGKYFNKYLGAHAKNRIGR